ncbi:hypothetical protein DPEC_G00299360 [Dallia pectoralis]|uniref:Uncharacterized protein n=1 Tax=Dallia pectoralis TaxID=75939 RepID=A0ACC2FGC0_DALPE|nr:hypothetical protein DPEC_G00299360 [Dallia pectoralis]
MSEETPAHRSSSPPGGEASGVALGGRTAHATSLSRLPPPSEAPLSRAPAAADRGEQPSNTKGESSRAGLECVGDAAPVIRTANRKMDGVHAPLPPNRDTGLGTHIAHANRSPPRGRRVRRVLGTPKTENGKGSSRQVTVAEFGVAGRTRRERSCNISYKLKL